MGLFTDSRRGITRDEYKRKLRGLLRSNHFTDGDLDDVDLAIAGYFSEEGGRQLVEPSEAKEMITWFRTNKSRHHLSEEQIKILEAEMAKFL